MTQEQDVRKVTRNREDWWQLTMSRMVRCHGVASLVDLVYDAVRGGLGFDGVRIFVIDTMIAMLVERVATDEAGRKVYPIERMAPVEGGFYGRLLADERMGSEGPGYVYTADATFDGPYEAACGCSDEPVKNLFVSLRTSGSVLGILAVSSREGRPVEPADAPPLVALAAAVAAAMHSSALQAQQLRPHGSSQADLQRRVAELEWLSTMSQRAYGAPSLDAVLDVVYDGIHDDLKYDRVTIGLIDHARGMYEHRRTTDAEGRRVAPADHVLPIAGDSPLRRVPAVAALLSGMPFYYASDAAVEKPHPLDGLLYDAHTHALAVPLYDGEVVSGIIAVDNALSGRPIAPEHAAPLLALANQIGMAVERARLLERDEHEHARPYQTPRKWASTYAESDAITGLFNHRAVLEHMDTAIAAGEPFTVVLLDIDNFRLFNDTHGHVTGDLVLNSVATVLRHVCREEDVAGRYGDDEFAVLLHSADAAKARIAQRRIESMVRAHPHVTPDGTIIPLAISTGMACYPSDGATRRRLIDVAENVLSEAKRGSRTRRRPQQATDLLEDSQIGVLNGLVTAVDSKDRYTREHSEDVTRWALLLAQKIGLATPQRRVLALAGPLHDVGKIAVPDRVLRKPGKLTADEYKIMTHHVSFGVAIIQGVLHDPLVIDAIAHHHERWDGQGYPHGLAGLQVPLVGRIMQIADAVSAMRLNRPYRQGLPWPHVVSELRSGAGTQFDPELVEPFIAALSRLRS